MKARYCYRIYPADQQLTSLAKLFGCCRVVYNEALSVCLETYRKGEKKPKDTELSKRLTEAKKTAEREWLGEVSSVPLQQSLRDLGTAYQNFFNSTKGKRKGKKIGFPKFKKRRSKQSARFTDNAFKVFPDKVYLSKIGELEIVWSRPLPSEPSSVTVIKDSANRYFLSFVVEINPEKLPDNGQSVGVDLGIIDFATLSNGEKIKSPKPLKKHLQKLKRLQKKLSRTQKGSKRRVDEVARRVVARLKVAKLHAKIADIRTDFLHKLSTRIIRENQTIVLEDLNTSGILKNRKLSRAISDLGWRSFRDMLKAKSFMYGRDFKIISRWEPTSQRCSNCGEIGGKKELNVREWTCLYCAKEHDRDVNASKNILNAVLSSTPTKKVKSSKTKVAEGHSATINGHGENVRLPLKVANLDEVSTTPH
jgi:putative transposase